ncbi:MAG: hypothetical protein WB439_09845, partial [Acidobacteriaceae bacterium]
PTPAIAAVQPVALRTQTAQPAAFTETAGLAPARTTQISADNHLLRTINATFDPSSDTPAALGLEPETAPTNGPPATLQNVSFQD